MANIQKKEQIMGSFSIWHWLIVLFIVLLLFGGKNKLSGLMGDMGKGLREFKDNFKKPENAEENMQAAQETAHNTAPQPQVINVQPEKATSK